jgi:hypothetical protein
MDNALIALSARADALVDAIKPLLAGHDPELQGAVPADWQSRDSAGSYADAIAALRKRLGAGWQPPQDSPYRARAVRT